MTGTGTQTQTTGVTTIALLVLRTGELKIIENLQRDITPRVMDHWPLLQYTLYIQSFSMFIQILSFLAFIVPEKSVMKIFKKGKILNSMKGCKCKNYGPLAIVLPLHLPFLRDQDVISFIEVGPQT